MATHDHTEEVDLEGTEVTWVNLRDASNATGVSISTLRKWRKKGELESRMASGPNGQRIEVPMAAVLDLAAERGVGTVPTAPVPVVAVPESEPEPATLTEPEPPEWAMELLARYDARTEVLVERLAQAERDRANAERDVAIERHRREQAEAELERLRSVSGKVKDAGELDAALEFIESRSDLDLGLWDLERDPLPRSSLLDHKERAPFAAAPAPMPPDLRPTEEETAKRGSAPKVEKEVRKAIHERLWSILKTHGWEIPAGNEPGTSYRLAVGPRLTFPHLRHLQEQPAMVYFVLQVFKRQAVLAIRARAPGSDAVATVLAANAGALWKITGGGQEVGTNVIVRWPDRGWDGSIDGWEEEVLTAVACVDLLSPQLAPVIEAAEAFHRQELRSLRRF